jgi:hypothetical protein
MIRVERWNELNGTVHRSVRKSKGTLYLVNAEGYLMNIGRATMSETIELIHPISQMNYHDERNEEDTKRYTNEMIHKQW